MDALLQRGISQNRKMWVGFGFAVPAPPGEASLIKVQYDRGGVWCDFASANFTRINKKSQVFLGNVRFSVQYLFGSPFGLPFYYIISHVNLHECKFACKFSGTAYRLPLSYIFSNRIPTLSGSPFHDSAEHRGKRISAILLSSICTLTYASFFNQVFLIVTSFAIA